MSLTNKIVANIKKTNVDIDSFLNTNNVVCIDTSNNRIGINTKTPRYSIDINGTGSNDLINVNKINIENLAIIKDISCLDTLEASNILLNNLNFTTISGNIINSNNIITASAEIIDLSISSLLLNDLTSNTIDTSYLRVDVSANFTYIKVRTIEIPSDGCFNVLTRTNFQDINIGGSIDVNNINSTNSIIKNIDCSNLNVDICANFNNNAFFYNLDISNIGTFENISGNILDVNNINSKNIINDESITTQLLRCNDTLTVDNIQNKKGDALILGGVLSITGDSASTFQNLNVTTLLNATNNSNINNLSIGTKLNFSSNAHGFILPSYNSVLSSNHDISKNLLCDIDNSNINILKFYNSNNKWSNIYTKTHYATIELNKTYIENSNITYNFPFTNSLSSYYNSLSSSYKFIPLKFKNVNNKEANTGFYNIIDNSSISVSDNSGIYEINASVTMKYLNAIPGDVEPNIYKFSLYSYSSLNLSSIISENILDNSYTYVSNINNILTFDNSFNYSSASLNYIGPLFNYNPPENFMFLISSNKDINQLIIEKFNCTIKLLDYEY